MIIIWPQADTIRMIIILAETMQMIIIWAAEWALHSVAALPGLNHSNHYYLAPNNGHLVNYYFVFGHHHTIHTIQTIIIWPQYARGR